MNTDEELAIAGVWFGGTADRTLSGAGAVGRDAGRSAATLPAMRPSRWARGTGA
jgi:hypothetical protein